MSIIKNIKTLFGIGPFLLLIFLLIELISIYIQHWIKIPIGLSLNTRIASTLIIGILLLSGIAWFNFTLNLIRISFLGGEKKLILHGPFNYVRHPLYSILVLTLPLFFIIWFNDYFFILPWIIIFLISHPIVKLEEKGLIKHFGKSYIRYRQYVPALFPYRGPNGKRHYEEIINPDQDTL